MQPYLVHQRVTGGPSLLITTGWHHIINLLLIGNISREIVKYLNLSLFVSSLFCLFRSALEILAPKTLKYGRLRTLAVRGLCFITLLPFYEHIDLYYPNYQDLIGGKQGQDLFFIFIKPSF